MNLDIRSWHCDIFDFANYFEEHLLTTFTSMHTTNEKAAGVADYDL